MLSADTLADLFDCPRGRLVVAYSGGRDSHVLLHLTATHPRRAERAIEVHALHVNHGLNPRAAEWADHCAGVAQALGVTFSERRLDLSPRGASLEARARRARYAAFREFLRPGDRLLMAHHMDDQAETILFQLLRGSGALGFRGMPGRRRLGEGVLHRPLLQATGEEVQRYAVANELDWLEDESNQDLTFDRNYLRHRVLPLVRERWPGFARRLSDGASATRELLERSRELAEIDLEALCVGDAGRLDWEGLARLPGGRQLNALRRWIERANLLHPTTVQLRELLSQLAVGREGSTARIVWRDGEIRSYRGALYLIPPLGAREPLSDCVLEEGRTMAAGGGELTVRQRRGGGVVLTRGLAGATVRYREGGERCRPAGRAGTHPLRKIFQEMGVPPWLRDRVPLVYDEGRLVAVAGLFQCHGAEAGPDEVGYEFGWRPFPPMAPFA